MRLRDHLPADLVRADLELVIIGAPVITSEGMGRLPTYDIPVAGVLARAG
ncbi:MAG TPA: hypothetical protein VJ925_04790 [Longimicrobiales bacterium]|nr:hypothetical protein [Longimicrobiales bacterium]